MIPLKQLFDFELAFVPWGVCHWAREPGAGFSRDWRVQ